MKNLFFIFTIILIYFNSIVTVTGMELGNPYIRLKEERIRIINDKLVFNEEQLQKLRMTMITIQGKAFAHDEKNGKDHKEYVFENNDLRNQVEQAIQEYLELDQQNLLSQITPGTRFAKDVKILKTIFAKILKYMDNAFLDVDYEDDEFGRIVFDMKDMAVSQQESLYTIQKVFLPFYYKKKYPELRDRLDIDVNFHEKVMEKSNLLKKLGWYFGELLWFLTTLPACSFWKEYHGTRFLSPWLYNLNGAPLMISTLWSLYLTIPLMVPGNILIKDWKMLKSTYDSPETSESFGLDRFILRCGSNCPYFRNVIATNPEIIKSIANWITLSKFRNMAGSFLHMTEEYLKGNELRRGFVCMMAMTIISNLAMYAVEPYSNGRIPSYDKFQVQYSFHYIFLGCKAVAIDLFGYVKGWDIQNVDQGRFNDRQFMVWVRKLIVDLVLILPLFTLKFMKAVAYGSVTKLSKFDHPWNQKVFSILQYIFTPGFKPSSFCDTLKKLFPPMVSMMIAFKAVNGIFLSMKGGEESELQNIGTDFADLEGVPLYILFLYMTVYPLINLGYKEIAFVADTAVETMHGWKKILGKMRNALGNNRILATYSILSTLFTAMSYYMIHPDQHGEDGFTLYKHWISPNSEMVLEMGAFYGLFLGFVETPFTIISGLGNYCARHQIDDDREMDNEEVEDQVKCPNKLSPRTRFGKNFWMSIFFVMIYLIYSAASSGVVTGENY